MKALAILLVMSVPALAAEPKVCKPEGKPLIKLQHLDKTAEVGSFEIFANGATSSFDRDPTTNKLSNEHAGCLRDEELSALTTALKAATWKTAPVKVHCNALSTRHTEWTSSDKRVWDEKTCASAVPDAETQKLIDLVRAHESELAKQKP